MSSLSVPPLFFLLVLVAAVVPHVRAVGYPDSLVQTECFNWYSENITAVLRLYRVDDKKQLPSTPYDTISIHANLKPTSKESLCQDPKSKTLKLDFSGSEEQMISLTLVVRVRGKHYWHLDENQTEVVVMAKNKESYTFNFKKTSVTAGDSFSFSCSRLFLKSGKATVTKPQTIELMIGRFQLQPFKGSAKRVFEDSFDCATWFTIPLWTGFLVTLFFTAILCFGVYALLGIKTPDRFENPKGKTISVTATD